MLLNKSDSKIENKCWIPSQPYRVRVIGTKFDKANSKGSPMTTLDSEIIAPERIVDNEGVEQNIAGRNVPLYLIHNQTLSGNQRESGQAQVFKFMSKLGLEGLLESNDDGDLQYDTDKHREYFLGMEFDIALKCEQDFKRNKPNKELGERYGAVMKDSEGNPVTDGWKVGAFISDTIENCNPTRNEAVANAAY